MILSVDCGINACGVGLFSHHAELHRAYLARTDARVSDPTVSRVAAMAQAVIRGLSATELAVVTVYVCEWPQVYSRRKSKGDPNVNILPLVGVAGAIAGHLPLGRVTMLQYLPKEWKGTKDGDQFVEVIKSRLRPDELPRIEACPLSLLHNVYDGIGVGLAYLGRLNKKRFISRGTAAQGAP